MNFRNFGAYKQSHHPGGTFGPRADIVWSGPCGRSGIFRVTSDVRRVGIGPGSLGTVAYWTQQYDPMGYWPASTFVAALPVLVLLGLLVSGWANAWQSALAGLVTAAVAAVMAFGMPPELVLGSIAVG